jgi:anaerobic magnesium-protoporphyrin IX monomethyl ester cyclase
MSRVLLVNPHYSTEPFTLLLHPPLGYASMAAVLKRAGHSVVHADLPFEGNRAESVISYLEAFRPDIVGITSVAQSYFHALEIARAVKEFDSSIPVVFGGPHPTFVARECLERHACVDFVVRFDGEYSMAALADALASTAWAAELGTIPGIAFRHEDGAIEVSDASAPLMELDTLPKVDRSLFDMQRYRRYDYETVIMTARGCPSRCTFCSTTQMGRRFRWHGVDRICDEVEEVMDMGFTSIFFGDDTFTGNRRRTLDFCKEMRRRGIRIPWTSNMRALDAVPEVLDAIREAGAYRVFMGFETIQSEVLDLLKKGTSAERLHRTAGLVKSHGLELHAAFIIGAPGDSPVSLKHTLDYIRLINPTVATFNAMEPRPGTDVFDHPEKYGLHIPNRFWYETTDWLKAPVCYSNQLSQQEIAAWVSRCYDEFCSPEFLAPEKIEGLPQNFDLRPPKTAALPILQ